MRTTIIELNTPVVLGVITTAIVQMREPTASDFIALGEPFARHVDKDGKQIVVEDRELVDAYCQLLLCGDVPFETLEEVDRERLRTLVTAWLGSRSTAWLEASAELMVGIFRWTTASGFSGATLSEIDWWITRMVAMRDQGRLAGMPDLSTASPSPPSPVRSRH